MTRQRQAAAASLCVAACAGSAAATTGWIIAVDYGAGTSVNPANPTCRVFVSARVNTPFDYGFAEGRFGLAARDGRWIAVGARPLRDPPVVPPNGGMFTNRLTDVAVGPLPFPQGVPPVEPENPYEAGWFVWETGVFQPRLVDVATATTRFDLYVSMVTPLPQSRLTGLVEGAGQIRVTPAPAGAAPLLAVFVLARRRR